MAEGTFILDAGAGLHARPAAQLVQIVQRFPGNDVYISKGDKEVNARSLLSVLSLGAVTGDRITVRCEGPQASEALAAIGALVESGFKS